MEEKLLHLGVYTGYALNHILFAMNMGTHPKRNRTVNDKFSLIRDSHDNIKYLRQWGDGELVFDNATMRKDHSTYFFKMSDEYRYSRQAFADILYETFSYFICMASECGNEFSDVDFVLNEDFSKKFPCYLNIVHGLCGCTINPISVQILRMHLMGESVESLNKRFGKRKVSKVIGRPWTPFEAERMNIYKEEAEKLERTLNEKATHIYTVRDEAERKVKEKWENDLKALEKRRMREKMKLRKMFKDIVL